MALRYQRLLWALGAFALLLAIGASRLAYDRALKAQFAELNERGVQHADIGGIQPVRVVVAL